MRRPRAMRFHAALRAAHDLGGFGHVQLLPVTHDKSLALTSRQSRELLLNNFKHLSSLQLLRRRFLHVGPVGGLQGFQRILFIVLAAAGRKRGEQRGPQRAHLLAAEPIADRVLHDAVKQKWQLLGRAVPVLLREAQHGVLDRKSTRLNSSHGYISYAVFCLKKKKKNATIQEIHVNIYTTKPVTAYRDLIRPQLETL